MAYRVFIKCDQCSKESAVPPKDWVNVFLGNSHIAIHVWSPDQTGDPDYSQACGAECVHKLLDNWLSKRKERVG